MCLLVPLAAQDEAGQKVESVPSQPPAPGREFYELKTTVDELRRQMNQLRVDVEASKSRQMTSGVYRSILKRLEPPRMTHEIILTNETVVLGNILEEDVTHLTLETTLGTLVLEKSTIRTIQRISDYQPKIEFLGDAEEEFFTGYRIYDGAVKNNGMTRADFVRVVFKLWDAQSVLLAQDSAFVNGKPLTYLSGVATDTAMEPEQEATYQVKVIVPDETRVEYMTREVHWDQVN
jgi:hypothetical protein